MNIAVFVDAPYFVSAVVAAAKEIGAEAVVCQNPDRIPQSAITFVDLSATTFDPIQAIVRTKADSNVPVIAFISTVQVGMRERATQAGADEVVLRANFMDRIEEALRA